MKIKFLWVSFCDRIPRRVSLLNMIRLQKSNDKYYWKSIDSVLIKKKSTLSYLCLLRSFLKTLSSESLWALLSYVSFFNSKTASSDMTLSFLRVSCFYLVDDESVCSQIIALLFECTYISDMDCNSILFVSLINWEQSCQDVLRVVVHSNIWRLCKKFIKKKNMVNMISKHDITGQVFILWREVKISQICREINRVGL